PRLRSSVLCGNDTLAYSFSKNTILEWYYMNDTTSSNYSAGYAQYYDAPGPVIIKGGCFYAYVLSPGDSAEVRMKLYSAASDSFPDQLLSQASVIVSDFYSATDLDSMKYCLQFPSTITIDSAYLLEIETSTKLDLAILSNSYNNSDGNGEGLSFVLYSDTAKFPGFLGWYDQLESPYLWDFDWILDPVVTYNFNVSISVSPDSICELDSTCVIGYSDSIVYNRMYNQEATPVYSNALIDWGDGGVSFNTQTDCHIYAVPGN